MSSEDVGVRAKRFEKIFADFVKGELDGVTTAIELAQKFKDEGASVAESEDYVKQAQTHLESIVRNGPGRQKTPPARERTPSGLDDAGVTEFRKRRDEREAAEAKDRDDRSRRAFEEANWANYLNTLKASLATPASSAEVDAFLSSIIPKHSHFGLPPGLALDRGELDQLVNIDPHIAQTNTIRLRYVQDKSELELALHRVRNLQLTDPVPHSVWKDILLDRYVNFDKLNHALQPRYNHSDEPKLELGDLVISDKSRIAARKPIGNVSDWNRVFGAWAEAVSAVYPHRRAELRAYHYLMSTFFRNHSSNPLVGIRLDDRIRESYSRCPFKLDDRDKFTEHTIAQLSASSDISKRKEAPSGFASLPKRPAGPVCLNWNGNRCKDHCPSNRRHGICCQCSGSHRAWDNPDCCRAFNSRFQLRTGDDTKPGPGGSAA
ncbi:hypothetical protein PM082_004637 [Marasmius tenuissimus]|nr:hypothetical protein PM082_004637 [Marasmius tenuissimus]